jgi:anti-anti-sigma regulatory factor
VTPRAGGPPTARRTVIESSLLGRGRGAITLTGDIDSALAEQFGELLDGFLDAGTRTVTVDGTRLRSYHPRVIELLGRAQQRSAARGGAITVTGLHPSRQTDGAPTPAPAEVVRSRVTD